MGLDRTMPTDDVRSTGHRTTTSQFIGYIDDVATTHLAMTTVRGWIVCLKASLKDCVYFAGTEEFVADRVRKDVAEWYRTVDDEYTLCGFEISIPYPGPRLGIHARAKNKTFPLFELEVPEPVALPNTQLRSNLPPEIVVMDNFYEDPDSVRTFALKQAFGENLNYYKGQRTFTRFLFPGIRERFGALLQTPVKRWDDMSANGVFQFCTASEQLVYHSDTQTYAGVVYLTPNAPAQCGTSFFRSKTHPDVRRWPSEGFAYDQVFPTGHYDSTRFELVDIVGNVYNRLVLWDAHLLHSASGYFGDKLENSRLFHLFFFDI
jgi:hypothetical protein